MEILDEHNGLRLSCASNHQVWRRFSKLIEIYTERTERACWQHVQNLRRAKMSFP